MSHTPTPWHLDDRIRSRIRCGKELIAYAVTTQTIHEKDTAALIVRAVNERAELVQCLEVAIYDMEERMSKDPGWRPRCLTRARAALKLAQE